MVRSISGAYANLFSKPTSAIAEPRGRSRSQSYSQIALLHSHLFLHDQLTFADISGTDSSYARQNRIHQALAEVGRIHKTVHILRTLDDEEYRRRMGRELNKGEASHELSRFLCFGKEGVLRGREFGDQLHTFSCLSVLHNAVVAWNMVHIEPVVEQLRAEGQRCDDELLSLTTPLLRRHLNPFGRYYFDLVRMRQDGSQLVELPSEPSASERVGP